MTALLRLTGLLLALGGCDGARDVALVLHELTDAGTLLGDKQLEAQAATLSCAAPAAPVLAALCVETYTLAGGKTTMRGTCHDAPGVRLRDGQADLAAYLRGLGVLADDIAEDEANSNFVRLLGYRDARRTELTMCGITPAFPRHLDRARSPVELAAYLLCQPAASNGVAERCFEDYCSTSGFIALFP